MEFFLVLFSWKVSLFHKYFCKSMQLRLFTNFHLRQKSDKYKKTISSNIIFFHSQESPLHTVIWKMCGVRVIDGKDGKISWVDFVELTSQLGNSKPFLCVAQTSVYTQPWSRYSWYKIQCERCLSYWHFNWFICIQNNHHCIKHNKIPKFFDNHSFYKILSIFCY